MAGMTVYGVAYLLPNLERRISEIGGGALPTPSASPYGTNQSPSPGASVRPSLQTMARNALWPTPIAADSSRGGGEATLRYNERTGRRALKTEVRKFPIPTVLDHKGSGQTGILRDRLDYAVERGATKSKTYPSPDVGMAKGRGVKSAAARSRLGGQLNPEWVEWLMGWPIGWTAFKPLAMDRFQQWLEQHGNC